MTYLAPSGPVRVQRATRDLRAHEHSARKPRAAHRTRLLESFQWICGASHEAKPPYRNARSSIANQLRQTAHTRGEAHPSQCHAPQDVCASRLRTRIARQPKSGCPHATRPWLGSDVGEPTTTRNKELYEGPTRGKLQPFDEDCQRVQTLDAHDAAAANSAAQRRTAGPIPQSKGRVGEAASRQSAAAMLSYGQTAAPPEEMKIQENNGRKKV